MNNILTVSDLRIGNYFNSVKFNIHVRCHITDLFELCVLSDGATDDPPINDMFEPIELTEQWLIKFGFNETYNSQFRLKYDHPCNYIGYDFSKNKDKSMEGFRYYGNYIKIKYVHELQNLYYSLTGKELE